MIINWPRFDSTLANFRWNETLDMFACCQRIRMPKNTTKASIDIVFAVDLILWFYDEVPMSMDFCLRIDFFSQIRN